jgi:hypothetical protein
MHIEILVEEPSAEAVLQVLVPKIVGSATSFAIHQYGGKLALLASLPARLCGYARWLPDDWRICVLVDQDQDDCLMLKQQLDEFAKQAGLSTPSTARVPDQVRVYNRIVIEELEAWFFGDPTAIATAYPRVSANLG